MSLSATSAVEASARAARRDDELMLLAASGQESAFGTLVGRHAERLRRYCGKIVGSTALAEELAQEIWLTVWNRRARYVADGKFTTFLYVVARNRCYNLSRDEKKRAGSDGGVIEAVASASPDHLDVMLADERKSRVEAALRRLPDKYRDVLVLRFSEELDYADIARVVNRSEAGVRTRVHVGLQMLKTAVEKGAER